MTNSAIYLEPTITPEELNSFGHLKMLKNKEQDYLKKIAMLIKELNKYQLEIRKLRDEYNQEAEKLESLSVLPLSQVRKLDFTRFVLGKLEVKRKVEGSPLSCNTVGDIFLKHEDGRDQIVFRAREDYAFTFPEMFEIMGEMCNEHAMRIEGDKG